MDDAKIELWRQADLLTAQLLEKPEHERTQALAQCTEALRDLVQQLLVEVDRDGPLDVAAVNHLNHLMVTPTMARNETIGPYQVQRLLGKGGMGSVYLVKRTDGRYDRELAMKLVDNDLPTSYQHIALMAERRVLARMNHSNIATLIDAGETVEGWPYLVMELIDGKPITEFVQTMQLDATAIVRLMLKVSNAVAHAHERLVVHRDLKPDNILVTSEGEPKVLDFGIAKEVSHLKPDASTKVFSAGYGAPEQLQGGVITTATDVYSLGVIMAELLIGSVLHGDVESSVSDRFAELVRTKPETVSRHGLDRALQNIVKMALRREPERRYVSARSFADDLHNWLESKPVRAMPDSLAYNMHLLWRKHRTLMVALGAAMTGIVIAAGIAMVQAQRATISAQRSQLTSDFMAQILNGADITLSGAAPASLQSVLNSAVVQLSDEHNAAAQVAQDLWPILIRGLLAAEDFDGAQHALTLAAKNKASLPIATQVEMLRLQAELAMRNDSLDTAHRSIQDAHALMAQNADSLLHSDAAAALDLTEAKWRVQSGEAEMGLNLVANAINKRTQMFGAAATQTFAAEAVQLKVLSESGQFDLGLKKSNDLLRRMEGKLHPNHPLLVPVYAFRLSFLHAINHSMNNLRPANFDESQINRDAKKLLELAEHAFGQTSPSYADALAEMSVHQLRSGNLNEAKKLALESLSIDTKIFGLNHYRVTNGLMGVAITEHGLGNYRAALDAAVDAHTRLQQSSPDRHGLLAVYAQQAASEANAMNNPELAKHWLQIAMTHYEADKLPSPYWVFAHTMRADIYMVAGNWQDALQDTDRAIDIAKRIGKDADSGHILALGKRAESLWNLDRKPEAIETKATLIEWQGREPENTIIQARLKRLAKVMGDA